MTTNDLAEFWKRDEIAHKENCFTKEGKQVALGIRMSGECVFAELGEEGSAWGFTPRDRRIELNKRYNDKAEKIVGKRLLNEVFPVEDAQLPHWKQIGEVFGGTYTASDSGDWLHSDIETVEQLEKRLDFIDNLNLREFILPSNWESEKKRIYETYGTLPQQYKSVRGPVTLATSIFGVENFIFLCYDEPDLAKRFSNTITKVLKGYIDIFMQEAGKNRDNFTHGFRFNDDDCNLLTPELYELFGYPVLKEIFDYVAYDKNDTRYQHSDSAMGHLLPFFNKLDLNGCNFGPTLTVREIRDAIPNVRIDGQLAPFTFMNNDRQAIIDEIKRDCAMAKENDLRGLNIMTAGSINNGSSLESMRVVMETIMEFGQY